MKPLSDPARRYEPPRLAILRCPLCHLGLSLQDHSVGCPANHQFDLARQGYLNLLSAHKTRSKQPGDNQAMVEARQHFHDQGFYQPLLDALKQQLANHLSSGAVADLGCGEGWYTRQIQESLPQLDMFGVDISKVAVKRAAARDKQTTYLVASSADLPLMDHSLAGVMIVFSRLSLAEIKRVLKPAGQLWFASPAPEHLKTLREALFGQDLQEYKDSSVAELAGDFRLLDQQRLQFEFIPGAADLSNLLLMTPFGWKAKPERQQEVIERLQHRPLMADFYLRHYQRKD